MLDKHILLVARTDIRPGRNNRQRREDMQDTLADMYYCMNAAPWTWDPQTANRDEARDYAEAEISALKSARRIILQHL